MSTCPRCEGPYPHRFLFEANTHTYYLDRKKTTGVTTALKNAGMTNYHDSPWSDYYMRRGSIIHAALSQIIRGTFDENWLQHAQEWRGYVDAGKKWMHESRFKVHFTEQPVYSCQHRYAGSPDLIGELPQFRNTLLALPDFKLTTAQPTCRIQTAAYAKAVVSLGDLAGYVYADAPFVRFPVELRKDGTYRADKVYDDYEDELIWYSVLALEHWREKHFGERRVQAA